MIDMLTVTRETINLSNTDLRDALMLVFSNRSRKDPPPSSPLRLFIREPNDDVLGR